MDQKETIRREIIEKRSQLTESELNNASLQVLDNLQTFLQLDSAKHVACFLDFRNEIPMRPIIDHLKSQGKKVYIPKADFKQKVMTFHELTDYNSLTLSKFGIEEPDPEVNPPIDADLPQVVLCPGVAFTKDCHRMGYGGGFYDRYLASRPTKPLTIGIALDLQIVESMPLESHDVALDHVVTPSRILP